MKKTLLIIATISTLQMNSQNCDSIKKENNYLREMLKIREVDAVKEYTSPKKVNYKLVSAIGDKREKTLTLNFILTNKVSRQNLDKINYVKIWDFEGNLMDKFTVFLNGKKIEYGDIELEPDVPYKYSIKINDFEKEIPLAKTILLERYDWKFEMEALNINWK